VLERLVGQVAVVLQGAGGYIHSDPNIWLDLAIASTAKWLVKRKGLVPPMNTLVLMLCTLPFVVIAAGIALLLGQPSLSLTLTLWGGMVFAIMVFFGALPRSSLPRSAKGTRPGLSLG
jgi:hypothetical protein